MLDILNSYARTLVLYPWIDLSPLLHAYASNFDALFVCFFFFFVLSIFFNKKWKNHKNTKTVCVCVYWYLCTLDGH